MCAAMLKRGIVIDAGLGDEGVGEARTELPGDQCLARLGGALPVAGRELEDWQGADQPAVTGRAASDRQALP